MQFGVEGFVASAHVDSKVEGVLVHWIESWIIDSVSRYNDSIKIIFLFYNLPKLKYDYVEN